uniref:Uncharacterized protein n=1 Tax=Rhizophora mucronata TaxID=61149 RepID=A0A2P2KU64_RHIMU
MKGAKRFAVLDLGSDTNDINFQNKRFIGGSTFDVPRAQPYRQQSTVVPPLDVNQAESSRQHVRALNTQFASWVQKQLKDHPDELWEDGVRDYLSHASKIMEKFSDVVNWLKANAMKERPAAESLSEKKLTPELKYSDNRLFQERIGSASASLNTSFTTSWCSSVSSKSSSSEGVFSGSQNINVLAGSQSSGLFSNAQSSALFSNSQSSGLSANGQASGLFSTNQGSGAVSNSQSLAELSNSNSSVLFSTSQSSGLFSNSQSAGAFSNIPNSGVFSTNQSSGVFSISQSLGGSSNAQTSSLFGLAGLNKVPTNRDTSDDAVDDDNELQQPSSPSVKKSEEKGIVVVHEVKCKLYIKVIVILNYTG